ncbi:MAG TPA: GGDEF domain-containing protein [Solirubrobacteraceae bacterium]
MDVRTIHFALAEATDLTAACDAAVTSLAASGRLDATAYLERAGRLRSLAAAGAAHVLDGVPVASGAIGRALRSGAEQHELAASGAVAELCVPVLAGGLPVGVLRAGAASGLDPVEQNAIRAAAEALGRRIEELGGVPADAPASRLAQHAAALAGLEDPARIERGTLLAALDLAEMQSALLLRRTDDGGLVVPCAAGPLARALLAMPPAELSTLEPLVAGGASCVTLTGRARVHGGVPGLAALHAAGAATVVVAPLLSRGEALGLLVVADARELATSTDRVELLELVAAQSASCLRTAAAVADLRHRAATDPLTGLGHRGTFHETLGASHRRPIATAVALCDVDSFKELNDQAGHQEGDRALREVAAALQGTLRRGDSLYRLGGDEFAALLAVRDDEEALRAAHRMCDAVRTANAGVTVSIGVAVSGPEEDDDLLVGRADRALYHAKAEGRDGVALAPPEQQAAAAPGA